MPTATTALKPKPQVLPLPPHYKPEKVVDTKDGGLWMVDYEKVWKGALEWKKKYSVSNAVLDNPTICYVPIDVMVTFLLEGGGLPIAGGLKAARLGIEWMYQHLQYITTMAPTMDTHTWGQIFHPPWLVDNNGQNPDPYGPTGPVLVPHDDVKKGKWKFNAALANAVLPFVSKDKLGEAYTYLSNYTAYYTQTLSQGGSTGKFELMVWPFHAMLGGIEHALLPSMHEMLFFHSCLRNAERRTQIKGGEPRSENYNPLEVEVTRDQNGHPVGQVNTTFLKLILDHDYVITDGFASSHCFKWFMDYLVKKIQVQDPAMVKKVYIRKYATAPVPIVIPGVVDFPQIAEDSFTAYAKAGVHVIDDPKLPLAKWPDVQLN
jgi:nicotinamidase-related amidase